MIDNSKVNEIEHLIIFAILMNIFLLSFLMSNCHSSKSRVFLCWCVTKLMPDFKLSMISNQFDLS